MENKLKKYKALVNERKKCSKCYPSLNNPSKIEGGKFDTDEIGSWSSWQGDLDAKILVVGQDWGDEESFKTAKGKEDKYLPVYR